MTTQCECPKKTKKSYQQDLVDLQVGIEKLTFEVRNVRAENGIYLIVVIILAIGVLAFVGA